MSDVNITADAQLFVVNRRQSSNGEVADLVAVTSEGTETIAEGIRCTYSAAQASVMAAVN